MTREEFLAQEGERAGQRTTITLVSADLLRWLRGLSNIPDEITEGARAVLEGARQDKGIRDFRVKALGPDLLFQVNTFGQPLNNPAVHRLIYEALQAAFSKAAESGLYQPVQGKDFFKMNPQQKIAALHLRPMDLPFTERQSEPIFIAKIIQGGVGAFNRMLFNLFFHPDKGSHQRLDNTRFVAIVENCLDLKAGGKERRLYAFGDRPEEDTLFFIYPFIEGPLQINRAQVGDWAELLSLIANPVKWVISAVYALKGRFVSHGGNLLATRHEPGALVSIESMSPGGAVENPVAILRLQSGLPAVGEAHFNLGADFHFVVGGTGGGYHLGVMPVTMEEARLHLNEPGTARITAYTYQSFGNGRIPPDHDVVDVFAQDRVQTEWLQREARSFIRLMSDHGEFQPYVTAEEAEARAEARVEVLKTLFRTVPNGESGNPDPLIARVNERSHGQTLSDIKADAGGKVGHTTTPTLFAAIARASLQEAKETGLIQDFQVFGVGDDLHLVMLHNQGIDANEIHLLAFRTFWREVWVTELIGYKPYALAQDLQIGPATKGKKVDDLAEPSGPFVELLGQTLPEPERSFLEQIRAAQKAWTQGRSSVEVKSPFAGNVTGQGPGFAEVSVRGVWKVAILAADKAGPAAFNVPLFQAAEQALQDDGFRARYGESIAFEIWDIHRHKRIFLDARAHREDIRTLLGATNAFNVKRLWSLRNAVSQRKAVEAELEDLLLAASTEKLALISGGQYVGKDDPVLLGIEELVNPAFAFLQRRFCMTQGDERGSHYMMLVPKPLEEAVATVRSRGLYVGLLLTLKAQGIAGMQDVFAGPSYKEVRTRIDKINARFWRAQGSEFTPVGVGAQDVEPAYPLMQVLSRLTGEGSPYAVLVRKAETIDIEF